LVGLHGVEVGDFKYRSKKIELGELQGNRFSIILRNIENFEKESVEFSKQNGFINYYGMQRFGTHSIPTFAAGIFLLKGQWEEAIELILKDKEEGNLFYNSSEERVIIENSSEARVIIDFRKKRKKKKEKKKKEKKKKEKKKKEKKKKNLASATATTRFAQTSLDQTTRFARCLVTCLDSFLCFLA
jgi:TruD family tRNA pseudouridine synthase